MKVLRGLVLVFGMLSVSACTAYESFNEVSALNEAQAVGSPFTRALASEYRRYANSELKDMFDYPDALHFARKGLAAASGETVMPEPLVDWNLLAEHIDELGAVRARLVAAFDVGARETDPELAAVAQAKFDCWVEQQEENWHSGKSLGCKTSTLDALGQLESKVGRLPPATQTIMPALEPVEPISAEDAAPMPIKDAMYLVFFDWNKATIGQGGESVLDAVAAELKKRGDVSHVKVVGHADTSGPNKYNRKLGLRRANTVKDSLVKRGVPAETLMVDTRGEDELLVKTADNVREPANRRANISFE
jgi:OOP family OmpA-OmpF porin